MFGKINMAILGCGNIAGLMAETIQSVSGVRAYAVASRSLDKAVNFAKQNGFKKAYGSYEELLQDGKVDLVYIATPHSEHYANAKLCISYGKPVLCEKAFTVNTAQAEELFRLAEEKNVFITEAMWIRYMPMYKTIKETLDSRVIGDPVMLTANLGYNIRWVKRLIDPELAGGALLDVGVYPLNFACMMFGHDILRMDAHCTYTETGLDEQDSITLIYKDGKMAVLNASMLGVSDRMGVIQGSKGYMVIENINNFDTLTIYDNAYNKLRSYKRPKQKTGYEYEVKACLKALKEGWLECPEMPHAETLRMMRLMDAVRRRMGVIYPMEKTAEEENQAARSEDVIPNGQPENTYERKAANENVGMDVPLQEAAKEQIPGQFNGAGQNPLETAPLQPVTVDVSDIKLEEGDSPIIQATQEALEAASVVSAEALEAAKGETEAELKEAVKEEPEAELKEAAKEEPEAELKEAAKEELEEELKEELKEVSEEESKVESKDEIKVESNYETEEKVSHE